MKNKILLLFSLAIVGGQMTTMAQTSSSSGTLEALPKTDRIVPFNIQDEGVSLPITGDWILHGPAKKISDAELLM